MSKRTILLIVVLFAVTVVLILLAVYPITQKPAPTSGPVPTVTPVAQSVLVFAPPTLVSTTSATYSIDVNLLTGSNRVNAVQLELAYDPKALTNMDATPGAFFENPVVLLKNIDAQEGRISYALAISPTQRGKQGTGTVAVLKFSSNLLPGQKTSIKFLPKTQVTAEGIRASVLKSTIDTTFSLGENSTTSATLSPATSSAR